MSTQGLNPAQQLDEYRYLTGDCRPKVLFGFRHLRDRHYCDALTLWGELPSAEGTAAIAHPTRCSARRNRALLIVRFTR